MDTVVKPAGASTWELTDLFGRQLGTIVLVASRFRIDHPADALPGVNSGPFDTIDLAMSEVERATRGVCQLDPGT